MSEISRDADGKGKLAGQRARQSGCMLMPGKGEWNGKALWQLVVLGDPRGDSDWAGGSWET